VSGDDSELELEPDEDSVDESVVDSEDEFAEDSDVDEDPDDPDDVPVCRLCFPVAP
jgi:hypothetical protein